MYKTHNFSQGVDHPRKPPHPIPRVDSTFGAKCRLFWWPKFRQLYSSVTTRFFNFLDGVFFDNHRVRGRIGHESRSFHVLLPFDVEICANESDGISESHYNKRSTYRQRAGGWRKCKTGKTNVKDQSSWILGRHSLPMCWLAKCMPEIPSLAHTQISISFLKSLFSLTEERTAMSDCERIFFSSQLSEPFSLVFPPPLPSSPHFPPILCSHPLPLQWVSEALSRW